MENLQIIPSQARYLAKPQACPDPSKSFFTIEGHISFDITEDSGVSLSSFHLNFVGTSQQKYLVTSTPTSGTQLHKDIKLGSKVFFEEEVQLIYMFHGGNVPVQKELQKGPHLFAFIVHLPHELPSTQETCLQDISYELQLSCLEAPTKSWFKSSRSWSQKREVIIHVHPTKDAMTTTNLLDLRLFPLSPLPDGVQLVARGQVPNARLGGCFDLSAKFTLEEREEKDGSNGRKFTSIRVGSLKVVLVQTATVDSPPYGKLQHLDQQQVLTFEKAEKNSSLDLIFSDSSGTSPQSTNTDNSFVEDFSAPDSGYGSTSNVNSESDVLFDSEGFTHETEDQNRKVYVSSNPSNQEFFPKKEKSYLLKRNVDFPQGEGFPKKAEEGEEFLIQPSTPSKTRNQVSFGHSLQVEMEVQLLHGDEVMKEEKVRVGNEFMLARKCFSTGEMTLPSYDAIAQEHQKSNS